MRAVIYSGGGRVLNNTLNRKLLSLAGSNPSITYIPATYDEDPKYFKEFKKYWSFYGVKKFINFPLDKSHNETKVDKALSSSILYFCGGNTFEFLKSLEISGLHSKIKDAAKNGSILTGQSAGIILLTPTINMASIPSLDQDENIVCIKKRKSLGILKFEFSPHYWYNKKSDQELKDYSKNTGKTIYACPDGSGLVINEEKTEFIGKVFKFKKGKKEAIK